jgi:hypothetical protein
LSDAENRIDYNVVLQDIADLPEKDKKELLDYLLKYFVLLNYS